MNLLLCIQSDGVQATDRRPLTNHNKHQQKITFDKLTTTFACAATQSGSVALAAHTLCSIISAALYFLLLALVIRVGRCVFSA